MKLLFSKEGFIYRPEQDKLLKELGLDRRQFVRAMEDGFGAENLSISLHEARIIVKWFEKYNYTFEQPDAWETYYSESLEEVQHKIRYNQEKNKTFNFRKIEWFDKESGFGKYEVEDRTKERFSYWFKINDYRGERNS